MRLILLLSIWLLSMGLKLPSFPNMDVNIGKVDIKKHVESEEYREKKRHGKNSKYPPKIIEKGNCAPLFKHSRPYAKTCRCKAGYNICRFHCSYCDTHMYNAVVPIGIDHPHIPTKHCR